jgi:DNA-binding NarL/FixJ family response regulator
MSGLEAIEQLKITDPHLKFIVLSMHDEQEYILNAMKIGVNGYLLKNVNRAELERAIKTVHEGGKSFTHLVTEILIESAAKPKEKDHAEITPREKEVLLLVANGQSTKQIADQLDISTRTVESHRINMLKKFKVNNTAELIRKAMELNILGL